MTALSPKANEDAVQYVRMSGRRRSGEIRKNSTPKILGIVAIALILLVVIAACAALLINRSVNVQKLIGLHAPTFLDKSDWELWKEFKQEHDKHYSNHEEEEKRFEIFKINVDHVRQHNKEYHEGTKSFTTGINHLADMEIGEVRTVMNGFRRLLGGDKGNNMLKGELRHVFLDPLSVSDETLPINVDWRQKNLVTPVKNQGQCGSCWAFSTTGSLEGQVARKTGKLISLSEQNLVDCSTKFGNNGCNGGLMDNAFTYIKSNKGLDTEKAYPYEGYDDKCRFNKTDVGATDKGFVDVTSQDESALKKAVALNGPISVAIDASHTSFQFYSGGVYEDKECSSTQLDHGVLVVGYGTTDAGIDYWLVKNSWGPHWGDEGYIKMARNRNNMCGVATQASYPLV